MSYKLSVRRASQESVWSLIIVAIFVAGLVTWITIPSLAYSMDNTLSAYANNVSTYVVVSPNPISAVGGLPSSNPSLPILPRNSVDQIKQIAGAQGVYPVVVNFTFVTITGFGGNFTIVNENGTIGNSNVTFYVNIESAVLGGPTGFPTELVHAVLGRAPLAGEAGFMRNGVSGVSSGAFKLDSNYSFSTAGVNFTAEDVGENVASPLFAPVPVLFDQQFVQDQLGPTIYNATYGGTRGVDYVIIKVDSIGDVTSVVNQVQKVLGNSGSSGSFQIVYDQAAITALESIESSTDSMYLLTGVFSLVIAVSLILVVSYLGFKRREWEVGLLRSQGWSWRQVYRYMFYYLLVLSILSTLLATAISYVLLHYQVNTFPVYGSEVVVVSSPQLPFVLVAYLIAVALSFVSPWVTEARLRRQELGDVLKEY